MVNEFKSTQSKEDDDLLTKVNELRAQQDAELQADLDKIKREQEIRKPASQLVSPEAMKSIQNIRPHEEYVQQVEQEKLAQEEAQQRAEDREIIRKSDPGWRQFKSSDFEGDNFTKARQELEQDMEISKQQDIEKLNEKSRPQSVDESALSEDE